MLEVSSRGTIHGEIFETNTYHIELVYEINFYSSSLHMNKTLKSFFCSLQHSKTSFLLAIKCPVMHAQHLIDLFLFRECLIVLVDI